MAKPHGLGKGLGALLGDEALQPQSEGSLSLPISQVQPGLDQPRKRFDEESLADLADSIRIHGVSLRFVFLSGASRGFGQGCRIRDKAHTSHQPSPPSSSGSLAAGL